MSLTRRPLDEISETPAIYGGVTLTDLLILVVLCVLDGGWVLFHLTSILASYNFIAVLIGLVYFVYILVKRSKWVTRFKRELPKNLANIYLKALIKQYSHRTGLSVICSVLFIFFIVIPLSLSLFGLANVGFLFAFYCTGFVVRKLDDRGTFEKLVANADSGQLPEVIWKSTTFGTSRYRKFK